MTDKEVLEQIKQSAKQIEIPDSITPERLSEKLRSPKKPSPIPPYFPTECSFCGSRPAFLRNPLWRGMEYGTPKT